MNCLKCGREIPEGSVFCPDCLNVMSAHPIAPVVHVQIPKRPARVHDKKPKELTPEEQLAGLKKMIRWLLITVAVLTAAVAILSALLFYRMNNPTPQSVIGQNYTASP